MDIPTCLVTPLTPANKVSRSIDGHPHLPYHISQQSIAKCRWIFPPTLSHQPAKYRQVSIDIPTCVLRASVYTAPESVKKNANFMYMYVRILYLDKISIVVGIKLEEVHRVFPFWVQPPAPPPPDCLQCQLASCLFSFFLCTGGAYYVTYSFRFISNKSWDGGEGRGSFT
jgi:hypothetical protein